MPDTDITVSRADFKRLEDKVDELHKDYKLLIIISERQSEQGRRIGDLEQRMKADEAVTSEQGKTLSSWVNRGIGVWLAAVAIWTLTNSPTFIKLILNR